MEIPLIQQTVIAADFRRSRHHIREMKMQYIRRRRGMFRRIFVTEYKKRMDKWRAMKYPAFNRYTRKRYRLWSDDTLERVGPEIHRYFGYSPLTSVDDMLMSFRRLYMRMYPPEETVYR